YSLTTTTRHPKSTLFPYTTLFRSKAASGDRQDDRLAQGLVQRFPERSRERSCRQGHEDAYVDVERKERLGLRQSVSCDDAKASSRRGRNGRASREESNAS